MASNPLVAQGTLNRLRATLAPVLNPQLTVTAPFLSKEGIRLSLEGNSTIYLPTMTGAVTSAEPYQMCSVAVHLVKTTYLATLYKARQETDAKIGDVILTPDAKNLGVYQLTNCSIMSVAEQSFAGDDAGFVVTIGGYYNINANSWNGL